MTFGKLSVSTQVLAGSNMPNDRDAEALKNVWAIYADEAGEFDHRRISNLHKSLDVRLIFVSRTSYIMN